MVNQLEREVFGSGSDLSDFEEEVQQRRKAPVAREEEQSSSGASSEDDYVQERPGGAKPAKKAVKKKSRRSHNGEEEDEVGRPRRQAQKKRKRQQQREIDLSTLPPEEAKKIRLDMQIDAIIKPKKGSRSKKRKNEDELDRFADDEVARLREAMINAADQDDIAIKEGNPALQKLRLLPEVMDVLRKASLAQSIVDNNLLQGVRRWLEPLPDRSIPALNIQREFFPLLKKMDYIDSAVLRESGLGKVMIFYTKCKRVQPDIARTAGDLVSTWSRPIIKRSASYRDRVIPIAQEENAPSRPTGRSLNAILSQAKESEKGRVRKNAVSIPRSDLGSYTVAPKSGGLMRGNAVSVEGDVERRRKAAERLRALTRKVHAK
ncbi:Transcription factor iws1 [Pleurotus pulmonarius]|nr:Transcription factor iws1 [Pleurotus pulmonarius]KAF4597578.1 Transcription factor iws1 [Pleurotus pulmonarius]